MPPEIPGFRTERVPAADGTVLSVATAGSGPAVVLLHGFPQTHLMWRHVAAALAVDHRVICPDLRGYGASDKRRPAPPTSTRSARWLRTCGRRGHSASSGSPGRARPRRPGRGAAGLDHPGRSLTSASSTSCRHSTCGTSCTAPTRRRLHLYLMAQPPSAGGDDLPQRRRLLLLLPRRLGHRADGDPARRAGGVPARLPGGRCFDRGGLPRSAGSTSSTTGRPRRRAAAVHAVTVGQQDWGLRWGTTPRPGGGSGPTSGPPHPAGGTSWPRRRRRRSPR
jgi:hypothetical protein